MGRDFTAQGPDRFWVANFTQLTTWTGTCYIAVVADAYSRLCLGWSVRAEKADELVLEALDMAIWRRGRCVWQARSTTPTKEARAGSTGCRNTS